MLITTPTTGFGSVSLVDNENHLSTLLGFLKKAHLECIMRQDLKPSNRRLGYSSSAVVLLHTLVLYNKALVNVLETPSLLFFYTNPQHPRFPYVLRRK